MDDKFSNFTTAIMKYVNAIDDLIKCLEEEKADTIALWERMAKRTQGNDHA